VRAVTAPEERANGHQRAADRFQRRHGLRSVDDPAAYGLFGWIGPLFSVDAPATSTATRQLLGWQPTHAGLLDDLDAGHYFTEA
jgi:hypothetical protein